jgi:hypothetical protein
VLAQFTTWDTANDAKEFFDAYSERTEKHYKLAKAAESLAQRQLYETGEGLVSIELRDKDVVIIEGVQSREQLTRASEQMWRSQKK